MQDHQSMQDNQPLRNAPTARRMPWIIAGISTVILAAGSGSALWTWHSISSNQITPPPATTVPSTTPNHSQGETNPTQVPVEQTAQVYWLKSTDTQLELAPQPIAAPTAQQPEAILQVAIAQLLEGPSDPSIASTIPDGTKLRSVRIDNDGIHVDLSEEFTLGGGSASMSGRLAQILYTATTLDPEAEVWLSVGGEPLEYLGGEGLVINQPMTRDDFQEEFSL